MILYIVRHAWAGEYGDPAWPDDRLRPLTDEGRERFARMVKKLARLEFAPELLVTSPLVRCRQTAEIVAEGVPGGPEVVECEELAPGADLVRVLHWMHQETEPCEETAWVGHAPDVGHLTAALIGDGHARVRFAKGAVAALRFPGQPAPGQGELKWLVTAKMLGC
jgi:phosphohistidine phosphatase